MRVYSKDLIVAEVKKNLGFKRIMDLAEEYKDQWVDVQLIDVANSKYGKGLDISAKLTKDYPGLPFIIESEMVHTDYDLHKGDKVKVKLYISPGGILIDQIKGGNKKFAQKLDKEMLAHARDWISDCSWNDLDPDEIDELSDEEVTKGVQKHYSGGIHGFIQDNQDT